MSEIKKLVVVSIICIGFAMLVGYQLGYKYGCEDKQVQLNKAKQQIILRDSAIASITQKLEVLNVMLLERKLKLEKALKIFNQNTEKINEVNDQLRLELDNE